MKRTTLILAALGLLGATTTVDAGTMQQAAGGGIAQDGQLQQEPDQNGIPVFQDLKASMVSASILSGGVQELELSAGQQHAHRPYLVLGSMSGTNPGVDFGDVHLGLQPDAYMVLTAAQANSAALENTFGNLDETGRATARIHIPPGLPPMQFDHAYVLLGSHNKVVYASGSVPLEIQ